MTGDIEEDNLSHDVNQDGWFVTVATGRDGNKALSVMHHYWTLWGIRYCYIPWITAKGHVVLSKNPGGEA